MNAITFNPEKAQRRDWDRPHNDWQMYLLFEFHAVFLVVGIQVTSRRFWPTLVFHQLRLRASSSMDAYDQQA